MSLENIILGLLSKPASGYDLKRAFDTTINYFWRADIAQVYRTLQRMEDRGLLKCREVRSDMGPPKKVYRRTAAGRRQLFKWLREEPVFGAERHTYVAQLVFLGELGNLQQSLEFLRAMRDKLTSRLAILNHIEACEPETDVQKMTDIDFHGFLGLRMGIQTTSSRIEWCDDSIALVEKRIVGGAQND